MCPFLNSSCALASRIESHEHRHQADSPPLPEQHGWTFGTHATATADPRSPRGDPWDAPWRSRVAGDAEAHIGVAVTGSNEVTALSPSEEVRGEPCASTPHASRSRRRTGRVCSGARRVVGSRVPVVHPFPNVPPHVVQAEAIRSLAANGAGLVSRVGGPPSDVPNKEVIVRALRLRRPSVKRRRRACPSRILPLGLRRETHLRQREEVLNLFP